MRRIDLGVRFTIGECCAGAEDAKGRLEGRIGHYGRGRNGVARLKTSKCLSNVSVLGLAGGRWALRGRVGLPAARATFRHHLGASAVRAYTMTRKTIATISLVVVLALSVAACGPTTQAQEFYDALRLQDQRRISEIVAHGADVDTTRLDGFRPLHFSIASKADASVDWLLAHGADVDSKDGGGNTPLLWAVRMKNDRVIDILLRAGADPCGAEKDGRTPRQMAREYADAKVLARLGPCKVGT